MPVHGAGRDGSAITRAAMPHLPAYELIKPIPTAGLSMAAGLMHMARLLSPMSNPCDRYDQQEDSDDQRAELHQIYVVAPSP